MIETDIKLLRMKLVMKFQTEFLKLSTSDQFMSIDMVYNWILSHPDASNDDIDLANWLKNQSNRLDIKDYKSISDPNCSDWGVFIRNLAPKSLYLEKYLLNEYGNFDTDVDLR